MTTTIDEFLARMSWVSGLSRDWLDKIMWMNGFHRDEFYEENLGIAVRKYVLRLPNNPGEPDTCVLQTDLIWVAWTIFERKMGQLQTHRLRLSDNVLDEEDWPTFLIYIEDDRVRYQLQVKAGIYSTPYMFGWTTGKVAGWLRHDNSGEHPEMYHDIYLVKHRRFGSFYEFDGGLS